IFMDEEKVFFEQAATDETGELVESGSDGADFLDRISGVNEQGQPACRMILRLGGEDPDSRSIQYDAGPVEFHSRDFGEIFLVDLKFPEYAMQEFRHTLEMFEQFVDSIDKTTGEYNPERMLSAIFLENAEDHRGSIIAQMPVFFAQTTEEFMGMCDTIRIAFIRNCLAVLTYEEGDAVEDTEEDTDNPMNDAYWETPEGEDQTESY
ncbi:MAG: hypothetical protein LUE86_00975, partial [Clostridiales bacterium]|nr:hypothetical protein [Clostridiales bacterium]